MKTGKIGLCLLMVIACLPSFAQSPRINGGTVATNKFGFYWETHLDPATPELANVTGGASLDGTDAGGIIHRYMLDRTRHVYFGYDVSVEVLPEPNTYRAVFSQLTKMTQALLGDNPSNWTPLPLPTPGWGFSAPRMIRAGEVIVLALLTNNATGQQIVDYVTIQEIPIKPGFENADVPLRQFAFATGSPRDFRSDDAELRIRAPRLSINGKLDPSTASLNWEASGPVVWIYIANRGRFLLSLTPHTDLGFRKAGEVRGSTLSFTDGPDTFNLVAGSAIAPRQAAFNLYVFHDPSWKPTYPLANLSAFNMGAADRAELLIHK